MAERWHENVLHCCLGCSIHPVYRTSGKSSPGWSWRRDLRTKRRDTSRDQLSSTTTSTAGDQQVTTVTSIDTLWKPCLAGQPLSAKNGSWVGTAGLAFSVIRTSGQAVRPEKVSGQRRPGRGSIHHLRGRMQGFARQQSHQDNTFQLTEKKVASQSYPPPQHFYDPLVFNG